METVFDAENNVEAHMIVHLLERSGIKAKIMGEHLQGGVGVLPAQGNIRVVVDTNDAAEARKFISEWETENGATSVVRPHATGRSLYSGPLAFLAGIGIASAYFLWAYNSTVTMYTADYNRDGAVDEWVQWRGDTVSKVEADRNHDGKVDSKFTYSPRNNVEKGEFDNDGVLDTLIEYGEFEEELSRSSIARDN